MMFRRILSSKKKWARFKYALKTCLDHPSLSPLGRYPELDLQACIDNYFLNAETARSYCGLIGAKYFNFLQPFNGYGRSEVSRFDIRALVHVRKRVTRDGLDEVELNERFYEGLIEKARGKDYFVDLREVFGSRSGEIYFDHAHCSDLGYDAIAKRMVDELFARAGKEGL